MYFKINFNVLCYIYPVVKVRWFTQYSYIVTMGKEVLYLIFFSQLDYSVVKVRW
jgi:hypothetical protein